MKENKFHKKTILIIGPYSSIGGVSAHIKRLANLLVYKYKIVFIDESPLSESSKYIYNLRNKNLVEYFRRVSKSNIIHIHTGVWWLRLVHVIIGKILRKKIIVTVHSLTNLKSKIPFFLTKQVFYLNNQTIFVNSLIKEKFNFLKNTHVIPAFLPPVEKEINIPSDLLSIIQDTDYKIIVANAYRIIIDNGIDLYGIDIAIRTAKLFKANKKKYKIIFVIASLLENNGLYEKYKQQIINEGIEKEIFLYPKAINFVSLIRLSDLVIRPTNSDGDALTIREALFLNTPIIASDVITRPEGTVIFKNRNANDLFKKIDYVLSSKIEVRNTSYEIDYRQIYFEIYNSN